MKLHVIRSLINQATMTTAGTKILEIYLINNANSSFALHFSFLYICGSVLCDDIVL